MATISFVKSRNRWRVRWRATNRKAKENRMFSGSQVFLEKADAVAFFADIEQQERFWRKGKVPGKTIETVASEYLDYAKQYTPRTQEHYRRVLKAFVSSLPKEIIWVQQISKVHVKQYLSSLLNAGRVNRTCNAHLTVIKSFCRYVNESYEIGNTGAKIKMFKEDPPDARYLKEDEYEKVLALANPLAKNRLIFLANTGLRASEFANLKIAEIPVGAESITIIGKGRKQRTIPLNKYAKDVLPELQIGSRRALYAQCSLLSKQAGIPLFGPHALRHYFATQLLLAGVPIIKVSLLMGHCSVKVTQQAYAHILPEDLQNVTDVLVKKKEQFPRIHMEANTDESNIIAETA